MTQEIPTWRIFSNPTRQKIIDLLQEQALTTGALCQEFELSRFAVMQHLRVLEKAGVISAEKRGRFRWNSLNHERLNELQQQAEAAPGKRKLPGNGVISAEFDYTASVSEVFSALTNNIDQWWTISAEGDSAGVYLEPKIGGRLYEQFDDSGNGVLFATVDHFKRDELLGFMGSMGSDSTISLIRMRLQALDNGSTRLVLRHKFIGSVKPSACEAFQQSWQLLLGSRLAHFISANQ